MKHAVIQLLILLCATFARIAPAQQAPAKPASPTQSEQSAKREGAITGRVIGPDGQPAPDALVSAYRVSERPGSGLSAAIDDDGNFRLTGLSPGAYVLFARAPGFIAAEVTAENAIHRIGENVTINLVKGGVITGRVTDETGEPIVGTPVRPHRLRSPEGKTTGSRFESYSFGTGMTDDRGIYRLYGLLPGVYIVNIGAGRELNFDLAQLRRDAPTYHPSATRDTAVEINLRGGEEVSGIDIRHRGAPGRIVSGAVSNGAESPSTYRVMLKGLEAGQFESVVYLPDTRGFAFYGVPDGEYELVAMREGDDDESPRSAPRRVSVKGMDVAGIKLKLAPLGSIAGRIVVEPSNPSKGCAIKNDAADNQPPGQIREQTGRRSVVEEITLRADRAEPNQITQRFRMGWLDKYGRAPNEKGEFALKGLEAGRYRITANLPDDGWRIRAITQSVSGTPGLSAVAAGAAGAAGAAKSPADASRNAITIKPGEKLSGLELIVAEDAAALKGRVVPWKDGTNLPSSLRVHLIPAEAASADEVIRYAETDIRGDGSFEFKHIAPGKYLLHTRKISENESNEDQVRHAAWDAVERAKLRREAAALKIDLELKPCQRMKDHVLRWQP